MSKPKQPPQVCISMPTYDMMQVSTCLSLIKLMDRFTMAKIKATVQTFKSPYVGYGRNVLTAMFLETGMDYQLFIDSDMEFEPDIIGRMIIAQKDAICVPYRKKTQDNAVRFSVAFENYIPKNSINTPLEENDQIQYLRKENERVRENNFNLKMQLIESREKLQSILKIIKNK
jgi:hypothetical protein